jgi:hypothetical protein
VSKRLTIASAIKPNVLQKRIEDLKERIRAADESQSGDDDWVLFNGFVVSPTVAEDARAFHVSFKDPCLVIFRAMDDGGGSAKKERKNSDNGKEPSKLGLSVMQTKSIYSGRKPEFNPQRSSSKSLIFMLYMFCINASPLSYGTSIFDSASWTRRFNCV